MTASITDASVTNAKLAMQAWQSWTPTWTNVSGGTLNFAKYIQIGKTVHFRLKYTLGGAGVSGPIVFSTPTSINSDLTAPTLDTIHGDSLMFDISGGTYVIGTVQWASSTTVGLFCTNATVTYTRLEGVSSTVPFTWATGDVITAVGTYEAA